MAFDVKKKFRLIVKLMIFVLMLACAGPFFLKDKNGRPFMSVEKIKVAAYLKYIELKHFLKLDTVPKVDIDKITEKYIPPEDREYTEMYKYHDAKGILHFTDIKPKNVKYEVLYMPVSKDKKTVGKTVDGLIDKVFNNKKKKATGSSANAPVGGKKPGQENIITQAKQMLQNAADQYKDAPDALNNAKELKKQVEEVYKERDKAVEEMK